MQENLDTEEKILSENATTTSVQDSLKDISNIKQRFREHQEELRCEHRAAIVTEVLLRAERCREGERAAPMNLIEPYFQQYV